MDNNIIAVNSDMEPAVIQGNYGRSMFFKDKYKNVQFIHCSDVHGDLNNWNRMVEYTNHYKDYISFVLQTGDYIDNNQEKYIDLYGEGIPCKRPILNCVGNHDTFVTPKWIKTEKDKPYNFLFGYTEGWDVTFMDIPYSMTYYKDITESNIRLIVLDQYYHIEEQKVWLKELLDKSMEDGMQVITAMHEPLAPLTKCIDTPFNSIENHEAKDGLMETHSFEEEIAEFVRNGGGYICNLCGHMHHDMFGYTESGILNIVVECGCEWYHHCDSIRVKGTRTIDAFNVMSVDVNRGILKLVRIGDNYDSFLRKKSTLCYDYVNKKLIW